MIQGAPSVGRRSLLRYLSGQERRNMVYLGIDFTKYTSSVDGTLISVYSPQFCQWWWKRCKLPAVCGNALHV